MQYEKHFCCVMQIDSFSFATKCNVLKMLLKIKLAIKNSANFNKEKRTLCSVSGEVKNI